MLMASSVGTVTAVLLLHTAAMVGVAGLIAFVIYDFVGVRVLRRGWLNLDRVWALADIYETELPFVKVGLVARATVASVSMLEPDRA